VFLEQKVLGKPDESKTRKHIEHALASLLCKQFAIIEIAVVDGFFDLSFWIE